MKPQTVEERAKEMFERQARGWRNAPPWEELHEDTREVWRDWVRRTTPSITAQEEKHG